MRPRNHRRHEDNELFVSNLLAWNPPRHPKDEKKAPPPPPGGGGGPIIKPNPEYAKALQAMMPYLSPEDRRSQASLYGIKNPMPNAPIPSQITGAVRNQYLSQQRASQALAALGASGAKAGPGMNFLRQAIGLLQTYGGSANEGISRANYQRLTTALAQLLEGIKGQAALSPYAALAQSFIAPTFTAGALMRQDKNGGFTVPSTRLFT